MTTPDPFSALMAERARVIGWKAAARHPDHAAEIVALVTAMEREWLDHLARGGDPGIETARRMLPGLWFELWRTCR